MTGLSDQQSTRLTQILDEYLESLEKGEPLDSESLLQQHPDIAPNLQLYFEQIQQLYGAAAAIRRDPLSGPASDESGEEIRKKLGDFTLVREIGRGGMGIVYEAIQESLGRRVALKVLPFASMFSPSQVARFRNEAQAAAQLQHPNIIPVYAIGAEKGIHFFAMPIIDGGSLDVIIHEMKNGGIHEKSKYLQDQIENRGWMNAIIPLGVQAAEALQAAHEVGIVHRDIKPSNLLLDDHGKLWIADFGLARSKLEGSLTRTGELIGTLRYMSPEQAKGKSALVDHRTDIYSLGISLYEVLALQPAILGEDGPGLLRNIEGQEPIRLRKLRRDIPKDLETVLEKAISKERDDRYWTAQEFADDLQRVLEGKPTLARPPGLPSRIARWGVRHKNFVFSATLIGILTIIGLSIGTVLIAIQRSEALDYAKAAQQSAREAQRVVDLLGDYSDELSGIAGSESIRKAMLTESLLYYQKLAEQNVDQPRMQFDVARSMNRSGVLVRELNSASAAVPYLEQAGERFEKLLKAEPNNLAYAREAAINLNTLGLAIGESGELSRGFKILTEAIQRQRLMVVETDMQSKFELAKTLNNAGLLAAQERNRDQADRFYSEARELLGSLWDSKAPAPYRLLLPVVLNNLASMQDAKQASMAIELYRRSIEYQLKLEGELVRSSRLAVTYSNLASLLAKQKEWDEARDTFQLAITSLRRDAEAAPGMKRYRRELATCLNNLALLESDVKNFDLAVEVINEAIEIHHQLLKEDGSDREENEALSNSSLGVSYNNLAKIYEKGAKPIDAAKYYLAGIEFQEKALGHSPGNQRFREYLSRQLFNFAELQRSQKQWSEALTIHQRRIPLWSGFPDKLMVLSSEIAELAGVVELQGGSAREVRACAELAIEALQQAKSAGLSLREDIIKSEPLSILLKYRSLDELVKP